MAAVEQQQLPGQPRVKELHELLTHRMVDVYVGENNTHWVLHERLLCAKSPFFDRLIPKKHPEYGPNQHRFGLPHVDDGPFSLFVGWLYSGHVPVPKEESELGNLFDLYLLAEKWKISDLVKELLDSVRAWYRETDTYPGLRRVQYIYANSNQTNAMRQLLINSVARMLITGTDLPSHWAKALDRNGQMAVDMIRAMTQWKINPDDIPDARQEPQKLEKEEVNELTLKEQRATLPRFRQPAATEGEQNQETTEEQKDDEQSESTEEAGEQDEEQEQEQEQEQEHEESLDSDDDTAAEASQDLEKSTLSD